MKKGGVANTKIELKTSRAAILLRIARSAYRSNKARDSGRLKFSYCLSDFPPARPPSVESGSICHLLRETTEIETGPIPTLSLPPAGILVNGSGPSPGQLRTAVRNVFRKLFGRKPELLTGAPAVRRMKTYSAQSGYVYQYFYEGHRGGEYVFHVSADRKTWFDTSVFVEEDVIRSWEESHSRELSASERYAIAKMALFQAFDERETPELMKSPVEVSREGVETILETLDL